MRDVIFFGEGAALQHSQKKKDLCFMSNLTLYYMVANSIIYKQMNLHWLRMKRKILIVIFTR